MEVKEVEAEYEFRVNGGIGGVGGVGGDVGNTNKQKTTIPGKIHRLVA